MSAESWMICVMTPAHDPIIAKLGNSGPSALYWVATTRPAKETGASIIWKIDSLGVVPLYLY